MVKQEALVIDSISPFVRRNSRIVIGLVYDVFLILQMWYVPTENTLLEIRHILKSQKYIGDCTLCLDKYPFKVYVIVHKSKSTARLSPRFCVTMALYRGSRETHWQNFHSISVCLWRKVTGKLCLIMKTWQTWQTSMALLSSWMFDECAVGYITQKTAHCPNSDAINVTALQNGNDIGPILGQPSRKEVRLLK